MVFDNRWRRARVFNAAILVFLGLACSAEPPSTPIDTTLRIYIARHGQTDWNAERKLQGHQDTHLNDVGREQAARLAELLQGVRFDHVYSSTLSRSRETAETVRGEVPLTSLAGLCEQKMGKFEGLKLTGEDTAAVAEYERRSTDPEDSLDGGESANQFFARVRDTVQSIREQNRAGTVLIVAHGGTNRMILRTLFDLSAEHADSIQQANDELYLVVLESGLPPRLWKHIAIANLSDL